MKIICVGRNYADHAAEMNSPVPKEPIIFMKPQTALLLPGKPLYYPEFTDDLQYECELVVRMNKNGRFISERAAKHYYADVTVGIDFTARDIQEEHKRKGLPWELAKAFDASAVVGEFRPLAQYENIQRLNFSLNKNEETVQRGFTGDMIFSVDKIISFVSHYIMLNIGDYIFTGTPAGVGQANVYDELTGYLEGEELFQMNIR